MNFLKGDLLKEFILKRRSFSMQEVGRKMIFLYYLLNLHDISRTEKGDISVLKKAVR